MLRMPTALADSMDATNSEISDLVTRMNQEIHVWNQKWEKVLQGMDGASQGQPSSTIAAPTSRVLCQPQFDESERPIDFMKVFNFPDEQVFAYETLTELLDLSFCKVLCHLLPPAPAHLFPAVHVYLSVFHCSFFCLKVAVSGAFGGKPQGEHSHWSQSMFIFGKHVR